jgi:hypothetical protein
MANFSSKVVDQLLIACRRRCCLCLRFRGRNLEIHHIEPQAAGGSGEADNGIPVCYDCHAEIESQSNMGRKFSAAELRGHRNNWFAVVAHNPGQLIADSRIQIETGPLEALLAEIEFNYNVVARFRMHETPLENAQFRRAIAVNALEALTPQSYAAVAGAYGKVSRVNYLLETLLHLRPPQSDYQDTIKEVQELYRELENPVLREARKALREALGGNAVE